MSLLYSRVSFGGEIELLGPGYMIWVQDTDLGQELMV